MTTTETYCAYCDTLRKKKDSAITREVAAIKKAKELEELNAALKEANQALKDKSAKYQQALREAIDQLACVDVFDSEHAAFRVDEIVKEMKDSLNFSAMEIK